MQALTALRNMQEEELLKRALDLTDSSVADALHRIAFTREDDDPKLWNWIGKIFWLRYNAGLDATDLDKAISSYSQSVKLTPDFDPEQATRLDHLGVALVVRFQRTGDLSDIDQACTCFESSILIEPQSTRARAIMRNLGAALLERFKRRGDIDDVERAVSVTQQAVDSAPDGDPQRHVYLNTLGNAVQFRFEQLGNVADLEVSIDTKRKAVELTPEGHPDRIGRLSNLSHSLLSRFERLGNVSDLEASIDTQRMAVDMTPKGHPDKPSWLSNLGTSLRFRFERLGNVSDLEASIRTQRTAVDLTPEGHLDKPRQLSNLGTALRLRFERLGSVSDLEASIDTQRMAVELTPEGHPDKPSWLNNLSNGLQSRFKRLGNVSDLEASIDTQRMAVELTPKEHPAKPSWLNNLSNCLQSRFERLGNVSDLEASIDTQRKALDLTPEGHPKKRRMLNNLGSTLQLRFKRLGNISDLEASINTCRVVVELTPEGHPDEPDLLSELGTSLRLRFDCLGNISDLETAIDNQSKAVKLTPEGHPERPSRLNNLGNSLLSRFERLGNVADLETSISTQQMAVELTPEQHSHKSESLNQLSKVSILKMKYLGDVSSFQETLEALSTSAQSLYGTPSTRLEAARLWGDLSELVEQTQQTIQAYGCAVSLIPQVAWMGLAMEGRHEALESIGDLVTRAAAAAVRYRQPDIALEWLEQGRSVVWGQTLQLRSPVDILHAYDPIRAERLTEISRTLDANSRNTTTSGEERGRQLRALSLEWDQILSEVRGINGFEDFMGPKKIDQLLLAASLGPIIVINAHETGCDALILKAQADEVIHIPLQFTSTRAQVLLDSLQKARSGRSLVRHADSVDRHIQVKGRVKLDPEERIKTLLGELWILVVKPVLDGLAFSLLDSVHNDLPRICWCPTGPLAFLPIHAAGLYDTEERGTKVFEFVVSSYTPTVTALLQSPSNKPITPKILAVAQAQYSNRPVSSLPETKHEIALIGSRAAANSIELVPAEDGAGTVKHVLEEMTKCSWIHLACHGIQDLQSPTKSAFILADGNLELEEIVKLNLPHAEFAFLSACQTATGDEKLAEEAVHLAAGMMLAGYRSVIATMWSIRDKDGPVVADVVYSELLKDGKSDASRAAHGLHMAVQQLRSSGASFLEWIPFIHLGR